jgi:hypothetical protein
MLNKTIKGYILAVFGFMFLALSRGQANPVPLLLVSEGLFVFALVMFLASIIGGSK